MSKSFPYANRKFKMQMDNGLEVTNAYSGDGKTLSIEFLNGALKGTTMSVPFTWKAVTDKHFLISWQETDKSTVVHCDNFADKKSYAYYTMMDGSFFVMEGVIEEIA